MARILLLLVIAFLVYLVIRALFRSQVKKDEAAPPSEASSAEGEEMVACARCGVNVPRSETREQEGRRICAANPNCK
jgi:uncharacterized protein